MWDLALVLETEHHHHHVSSKLKAHIDLYSTEVSTQATLILQINALSDLIGMSHLVLQ